MVLRMPGGGGHQLGPTHSHSFEAMFLQIPGLLVACPSTPADGKGLLKAAIRDDNPVIFIEHESLYGIRGEVPENGDGVVNFGEAAVRREGSDVTIVAILRMVEVAMQAAKTLSEEHGVEAEVIDPRTLRPLDLDTILRSVEKTNRVVIVEEGWPHGGVGANLAALIQGQAFDYLDAPVERVTGADVHMPYSRRMEQAAIPTESTSSAPPCRRSRGPADGGRGRHAPALRLDGGGHRAAVAQVGRRRGCGRRGAG
jgi:pyruvate dehydrogenase E1 component beta subunit